MIKSDEGGYIMRRVFICTLLVLIGCTGPVISQDDMVTRVRSETPGFIGGENPHLTGVHRLAQLSCEKLRAARNSIYKVHGYCFKTPEMARRMGNEDCKYGSMEDVPMPRQNRNMVEAIRRAERLRGC
jgi:hypothetical protein